MPVWIEHDEELVKKSERKTMNDEITIKATVEVDTSQLDEAIAKAENLNSIMKETREIALSLASDINSIDLKVDVNV